MSAAVRLEWPQGHITVMPDDPKGAAVVLTDQGSDLHVWAFSAAHLDTVAARALGEALIEWAEVRTR